MAGSNDLTRLVPGFDFLQGLMKNAGAALPGMNQWIAPTLNPEELDKRIQELRTVQFWLEQNAKLLATTIQALEVQRMTLSTLQSMNLPLADLREALTIKSAPVPAPAPMTAPAPEALASSPASTSADSAGPAEKRAAPPPAIDPMQWWTALTQQFGEIAAKAIQETAKDAPPKAESAKTPVAARRKPAAKRAAKTAVARKRSG